MLQSLSDLEIWHSNPDPWGYETHPDDTLRKKILLAELPTREYAHVLDIGCGQGFITPHLPGRYISGVDISAEAITKARQLKDFRLNFRQESIFDLSLPPESGYDLIVITGVLYPQYIGNAHTLIYRIIDSQLADDGILVCVHIDEWYKARFPYLMLKEHFYAYREHTHRLEVYVK
ncbi:MAG: class I SAM-dependent methyltransferase [Rhodocyclaceae bacterium]|nr:class I SAM-dependent methyltransferase [Rhodocyclaceae bacterium]MDZ4214764.1 class I SAM-dependent methyltransferase [Rhodocyclaceae bacterium]